MWSWKFGLKCTCVWSVGTKTIIYSIISKHDLKFACNLKLKEELSHTGPCCCRVLIFYFQCYLICAYHFKSYDYGYSIVSNVLFSLWLVYTQLMYKTPFIYYHIDINILTYVMLYFMVSLMCFLHPWPRIWNVDNTTTSTFSTLDDGPRKF